MGTVLVITPVSSEQTLSQGFTKMALTEPWLTVHYAVYESCPQAF